MEMKRSMGLFLMLLIVLASQEAVMPTEARICESKSHRFRGVCMSNSNCASVCHNEGFPGGRCRGVRKRCFCTKVC
ncbi:defensin-like protein 1 [Punica granatum]|uniref:Defensin-like protein 1 n=1 Tax=Punica granatum TaxID=22663 RepID=A0A218WB85_PUNGR|nr:defensin-like protein 1 [Punica granatum]OWM69451.1 hypothetical protein CDL15_Pgr013912 [Punica granatum]